MLQTPSGLPETYVSPTSVFATSIGQELEVGLGRVGYCLNALIEKRLLQASNFCSSENKLAFTYLLAPAGFEEKARVTV